jgi:hypothetical protein
MSHQNLARYMRAARMPKEHARLNAHACVLADIANDISEAATAAGLTATELESWLREGAEQSITQMPYLGRLRELIYWRLRNPEDPWEANDLNDMHFLACAAGYADIVVGEKKTSDYLQRAARAAPTGAHVCSSLTQAYNRVKHLGFA